MTMFKNLFAAFVGMLIGTAAMAAQNWGGQTHEIRDVLNCRSSRVFSLKNAEGQTFLTDQIQIVQNSNRGFATLMVNGRTAGLASYARSNQQVTVRAWDVKFSASLRAVDANGGYASQKNNTTLACALTRAQFEL